MISSSGSRASGEVGEVGLDGTLLAAGLGTVELAG